MSDKPEMIDKSPAENRSAISLEEALKHCGEAENRLETVDGFGFLAVAASAALAVSALIAFAIFDSPAVTLWSLIGSASGAAASAVLYRVRGRFSSKLADANRALFDRQNERIHQLSARASRVGSTAEKRELIETFVPFAGARFSVNCTHSSGETTEYANWIAEILWKARLVGVAAPLHWTMPPHVPDAGIGIAVTAPATADERTVSAANAIAKALGAGSHVVRNGGAHVEVWVGEKPE